MLAVETRDLVRAQELSDKFDAELWRVSQTKNDSPQPRLKGGTRKLQVLPDALLQPELRYLSIMSPGAAGHAVRGTRKDDRGEELV
jgi:hypothetical protein